MKTVSHTLTTPQNFIRFIRKRRQLSLDQMADLMDVNAKTLKRLSSGKTKHPSQRVFAKLLKFYCCVQVGREYSKDLPEI